MGDSPVEGAAEVEGAAGKECSLKKSGLGPVFSFDLFFGFFGFCG